METKLSILKRYMTVGDYRAALRLAAGWGHRGLGGGAHATAITRAWAAAQNPGPYREMGYDIDNLISLGIKAIKERYHLTEDHTDVKADDDEKRVRDHHAAR